MNVLRRFARLLVAASLVAPIALISAPAAFAGTQVVSAGSVTPGGTSGGTATFTFTENSIAAFGPGPGTLTVTITDALGGSTVHFTGAGVLQAPGSLGATLLLGGGGNSFTVSAAATDTSNIEKIIVSGYAIKADAGAATGDIVATLSGSLAPGTAGNTSGVTGGTLSTIGTGSGSILVTVNTPPPCGFDVTGGTTSTVTFSDVSDPRVVTAVTGVSGGQQTLTLAAGVSVHGLGVTVTQTVANCLGTQSPGTVGAVSAVNHLTFTVQPGGGAAGAAWIQQPTVAIQNASNVTVTTDNTTVVSLTLATNPGSGTLSCAGGNNRTVVAGVATFTGCSISVASSSQYTLSATSSPGYTPATSSGFSITTATNHLAFQTSPGGGAAGAAWATQPVVAVQNPSNVVVTTDNTTVVTLAIATNPAGGVLTCTGGNSRTVVSGLASFAGCFISIGSASPYTLTATSTPALTAVTSPSFFVTVALTTENLTDAIAPGVNHGTSGFGTSSLVVPANSYVTVLGSTNPNLSGAVVQIWGKTRTTDWALITARFVEADGSVHYFARINGWHAFQLRFAGSATLTPAASHGRIATSS